MEPIACSSGAVAAGAPPLAAADAQRSRSPLGIADAPIDPAGGVPSAWRVGATWLLLAGLIHLAARAPLLWGLRLAMPYITWPALVPVVAWQTRRMPLAGWRGFRAHLPLSLVLAVLHGLLFRSVMWALGGNFGSLPRVTALPMILSVELSLYFSTAWALSALRESRRADEAELSRARVEAEIAGKELAATLGRLGPTQLDELLARLRGVVASRDRPADSAVGALARYLRISLDDVDAAEWSLDRELEALERYLEFESACAARPIDLVVVRPIAIGAPVGRYTLVAAAGELLRRVPVPAALRLARSAGGYVVQVRSLGNDVGGERIEVPA